ncbi:PD-(D/E)XK nuclease family protein [Muriicola sp. Z0-33]|uniref:PD-(D/E)XK nuclease family protein n=1 Tax=Muriicola sp. Z0-33 TaxID=2816957 RepID=UPI0022370B1B|nr:PD-(D/E)XK nuclease family protein [Muriicola sp. Z0-33]MCW5514827.1 PD-(D/E)XK nuclease family protein [Muriicola sp. Z0-33]
MQSFLEEVVDEVWKKYDSLEDLVFILPSKRAGSFLRNIFASTTKKTLFSPQIYSIESFVEKISGLTKASNTQLLFELFNSYNEVVSGEKENFYDFTKWAQMVLQDFNEIDRYLISPDKLFSYLTDIQELNHWYLKSEKTPLIQNYLEFWKQLPLLYQNYTERLVELGIGYQGLIYRMACANLTDYLNAKKEVVHIFIGFNALNTAESYIIQEILSENNSDIYWDIDSSFLNDPIHDAGYFIRQHKRQWNFLQKRPLKGISNHYNGQKMIQIAGIPKNVSQMKYVGYILEQLRQDADEQLTNTAVVLGDETLLNPLLNTVPQAIESVNITMGFPLSKTPLSGMFKQFFELYLQEDKRGLFYKNVFAFLSNNYIQMILLGEDTNALSALINEIRKNNWAYITTENLIGLQDKFSIPLLLLFSEQKALPESFLERCLQLVNILKQKLEAAEDYTGLEYLYHFHTLFNQLMAMIKSFPYIKDLKTLYSLFKELLSSETIDFQGEPMQGLQIMGMLESRNLDFETVIITSVNEGILPSGKSGNSFIPFDVKKEFKLPTYKEKDAVYTYHFYRLLQRARNIYVLYNTEADVLEGGEKSRFINQLLTDNNKNKQITHLIATPLINTATVSLQHIKKDDQLMTDLKKLALRGLSPTSLSEYIRNPIDFYKKAVLQIPNITEVEEAIAANTFGTIIHDVLEELYTPFIGSTLSSEKLETLKPLITDLVGKHFKKTYANYSSLSGKNLIAFHVVCRYIHNFLDLEKAEADAHSIRILGLEEKLSIEMHIPGIDFPVLLKGKLDRIDERNGTLRIIDYKTGLTNKSDVEIYDWSKITTDYAFSKAFQLLCYSLMYSHKNPVSKIEAGIVSFKNLNAGLLSFGIKPTKSSRKRDPDITPESINLFKSELYRLISEIFAPEIAFEEKEV